MEYWYWVTDVPSWLKAGQTPVFWEACSWQPYCNIVCLYCTTPQQYWGSTYIQLSFTHPCTHWAKPLHILACSRSATKHCTYVLYIYYIIYTVHLFVCTVHTRVCIICVYVRTCVCMYVSANESPIISMVLSSAPNSVACQFLGSVYCACMHITHPLGWLCISCVELFHPRCPTGAGAVKQSVIRCFKLRSLFEAECVCQTPYLQ